MRNIEMYKLHSEKQIVAKYKLKQFYVPLQLDDEILDNLYFEVA